VEGFCQGTHRFGEISPDHRVRRRTAENRNRQDSALQAALTVQLGINMEEYARCNVRASETLELMSATDYIPAQRVRNLIQQEFRKLYERIDVIVAPSVLPRLCLPTLKQSLG